MPNSAACRGADASNTESSNKETRERQEELRANTFPSRTELIFAVSTCLSTGSVKSGTPAGNGVTSWEKACYSCHLDFESRPHVFTHGSHLLHTSVLLVKEAFAQHSYLNTKSTSALHLAQLHFIWHATFGFMLISTLNLHVSVLWLHLKAKPRENLFLQ